MKNIIKITALTVVVSFLSVTFLSAQEHDHSDKSDKKTENHQMMDAKKMDKNKDGKVYQCSMCSDQVSDKPGECPNCGMKLSEVSVDEANKKLMNGGKHMMDDDKLMKDGKKMMDHDKMMKDGKHMMNHDKMMKHGKKMMDHNKMMKDGKNSFVHEGIIDLEKIDANNDGKVFQDMMDWNVISDKAGKCPNCGMKLKEVSINKAKDNLKKHGYKTK